MREFAANQCSGAEFAVGWLDARRHAQQRGERVRDPLETRLDRVFSLLEKYSIDPEFTGPDDLSHEELRQAVARLMQQTE
ncbi:colicin immunity domain-containing protein [Streptomyces sp. MBT58]|uniref:colicin immunity domain-containing protein n=1 Tax=Streptomyces sp. MBT58 TaxID=1488389 RepID=UPI001F3DB263|nr:colicin immunity domain-containing protein [Streptomyces sp. MBT58]